MGRGTGKKLGIEEERNSGEVRNWKERFRRDDERGGDAVERVRLRKAQKIGQERRRNRKGDGKNHTKIGKALGQVGSRRLESRKRKKKRKGYEMTRKLKHPEYTTPPNFRSCDRCHSFEGAMLKATPQRTQASSVRRSLLTATFYI